jgi:hypothetical protein
LEYGVLFDQIVGGEFDTTFLICLSNAGRQQGWITIVSAATGKRVMAGPGITGVGFSFEHQYLGFWGTGDDGGHRGLFFNERFHIILYSKFPPDPQERK